MKIKVETDNVMNEIPKIEFKITTEQIQALLEGKKLVYNTAGLPQVTLIPDRYGVFMTYDKYHELRKRVGIQIMQDPDTFLKDLFPDTLYMEIIGNLYEHNHLLESKDPDLLDKLSTS